MANGQEFKGVLNEMKYKPDVICIQETWLKESLDFVIRGYSCVRRDRVGGNGGGCATFVRKGIQYRELKKGNEQEYIIIEVWTRVGSVRVINFYNPCKQLEVGHLEEMWENMEGKTVWCGDFNAHSAVWGNKEDSNGRIVESFMEEQGLVCLNDGTSTRIDVVRGTDSALDLTIVSRALAHKCNWQVHTDCSIGSDHFPITTRVELEVVRVVEIREGKWILGKADWEKFMKFSDQSLATIDTSQNIEDLCIGVTCSIVYAAREAIPMTKPRGLNKIVPWWGKDCSEAIKQRNKAFRVLRQTYKYQHLIDYKRAQALVRRVIKKAKKEYWRSFCNTLGRTTPIEKVWGMIKRMRGKGRGYEYPVMMEEGKVILSCKEKAEAIARTLVKVHSSNNLRVEEVRARQETRIRYDVQDRGNVEEEGVLNRPFTLQELNRALQKAGRSTPGRDRVCYSMLEHLSVESKGTLLHLYNKVWEEGVLPISWKESIIVPIRKPGKDPRIPSSYRPIALTSQMGKTLERMVNDRMVFFLESRGLIHNYQSGFRKGRSTMDPIIALEDAVRRAQVNKESVAAVYFDIERAYDMLWREGLLIKLSQLGVRGRIWAWVKAFLSERKITVRINGAFSNSYGVENGTPQGSIISPLLFTVMINEAFKEVDKSIDVALFADDGAMWKRGRNVEHIVQRMQQGVDKVQKWALDWGFRISVEKTKFMLFTKRRSIQDLKITVGGSELERVEHFKYLGMWFDKRLTWAMHIQKIIERCKRVLNVMRCLKGTEWGADRTAMKTIYSGLIRSVLDYGCVAYRSAAESILKKLDLVQYQALRICMGAIKTSPVAAMQVELGEMPLHLRRDQLSLVYWANLMGHQEGHIGLQSLMDCQERRNDRVRSFGWVIGEMAREVEIRDLPVCPTVPFAATPWWTLQLPLVDLGLLEAREEVEVDKYYAEWYIQNYYGDSYIVYTDASKKDSQVGAAFVIPKLKVTVLQRLSDNLAVYTAELVAILLALSWVDSNRSVPGNIVIATDSTSALHSIKNVQSQSRQDIIIDIIQMVSRLQRSGVSVTLMWVPAHIGVTGNELADQHAKKAVDQPGVEMHIKYSKAEMKCITKVKIRQKWQELWDKGHTGRHLYNIQKTVGRGRSTHRSTQEEDIISRMRIGHTGLNNIMFLIKKHVDGKCSDCGNPETPEHVVESCTRHLDERQELSKCLEGVKVPLKLSEVLLRQTGEPCFTYLFTFLKETGLLWRL